MMGRTHSASGLAVGLALAPALGLHQIPEVALFATATAGFALAPDLDHPGARASLLLGPFTGGISWALRRASGVVYQATKGPRDEAGAGTHRHLSHTVLFAVALGGLATLGAATIGSWFVLGAILFGVLLAQDALGDWLALVAGIAGLLLFVVGGGFDALTAVGGWIGIAVCVGCITHDLGDALTLSGCPFLWPIPIRGETWFEVRPPAALRFRTGGWFEDAVVMPVTVVVAVLLCPVMGPWLVERVLEALD